jgi:hydrogenase maturation protease
MDTLVLGIGNLLWADEGFGVRAVSALNDGWRFPDAVTLMDGGTQGLYLLPYVQEARRILVFDAIDYGLEPGTLQVVRDGDIPAYLGVGKMSLHQSCFQEVLSLAQLSGQSPEKAVLVGVQPKALKDFGGGLTDIVRARLPEALAIGLEVLAGWGVAGTPVAAGEAAPEPLIDPSLAVERYEGERPSEGEACRVGDARFLAIRGAIEG